MPTGGGGARSGPIAVVCQCVQLREVGGPRLGAQHVRIQQALLAALPDEEESRSGGCCGGGTLGCSKICGREASVPGSEHWHRQDKLQINGFTQSAHKCAEREGW